MSFPKLPECKSDSSDSFNAGVLAAAKLLHSEWKDKLALKVLALLSPPIAPLAEPAQPKIDKSDGVKMGAFAVVDPPPLPVDEKFTLWLDDEGDYMIQSQRETGLVAHADNPESAVYVMRQVLDMAASIGHEIPPTVAPSQPKLEEKNEESERSGCISDVVGGDVRGRIPADICAAQPAAEVKLEELPALKESREFWKTAWITRDQDNRKLKARAGAAEAQLASREAPEDAYVRGQIDMKDKVPFNVKHVSLIPYTPPSTLPSPAAPKESTKEFFSGDDHLNV